MSSNGFYKVPIELCEHAIKNNLLREAQIWLTGVHLYYGKAKPNGGTYEQFASACGVSKRTVMRTLNDLEQLDWVYKNRSSNWLHFRGKKQLRAISQWSYSRSALIFTEGLSRFKAFCIGAIVSNFIKRNKGAGTGCKSRRPVNPWHPVSLSIFQSLFDVSQKTAFNYRKLAVQEDFLKMRYDIREVADLYPNDLKRLKQNNIENLTVHCLGYAHPEKVNTKQLRTKRGKVVSQFPNLLLPNVIIKRDK
ncbi:MAG TPA: hypothetical protein DD671_16990 [Balneolaceae bacterium]|nr:hypothetical protein [Balneolaceae bacterium]